MRIQAKFWPKKSDHKEGEKERRGEVRRLVSSKGDGYVGDMIMDGEKGEDKGRQENKEYWKGVG